MTDAKTLPLNYFINLIQEYLNDEK
jgi:hypothetical protein